MYRIFIIENEVNTLYALQVYFSVRGHNVYIANGTGSKRKLLENIIFYKPDFIILDILLAEMDGFELIEMIKNSDELFSLPLFIYANLDEKYFRKKVVSGGGEQYYYQKQNININEFARKCLKIMSNKHRKQ